MDLYIIYIYIPTSNLGASCCMVSSLFFPPTSRLSQTYFRPGVSWELRINWRRRHLLIPSSGSCTMLYKVVPPFDSVQLVNITPMSLWFIYRWYIYRFLLVIYIYIYLQLMGLSTNKHNLRGHHLVPTCAKPSQVVSPRSVPWNVSSWAIQNDPKTWQKS